MIGIALYTCALGRLTLAFERKPEHPWGPALYLHVLPKHGPYRWGIRHNAAGKHWGSSPVWCEVSLGPLLLANWFGWGPK